MIFIYKAKHAHPQNQARLRGFTRLSALDWHWARNLSRPEQITKWLGYLMNKKNFIILV